MSNCCSCAGQMSGKAAAKASLPLLCLVPRSEGGRPLGPRGAGPSVQHSSSVPSTQDGFQLLDSEYIKKHFKLQPRALYLDPFRRPLITFPMTQELSKNFNLGRKYKINQQILDGILDPSEAIMAPSVLPYAKSTTGNTKESEADEEVIYLLQLPDWEFKCPIHNQAVRTPRLIWHSVTKQSKKGGGELKPGGGPMNKPKPWMLSRHTDFDLLSQW